MRESSPDLGSSPLARGLRPVLATPSSGVGIIPARAGFTRLQYRGDRRRGDHPRSRGVYFLMGMEDSRAEGSSPLARGLRINAKTQDARLRIIPARAGFTPRRRPSAAPHADHPRSRGVYPRSMTAEEASRGSSPLARGLPQYDNGSGAGRRIIPARAGFTEGGARPKMYF